jgi:hypothetical protein
MKGCGMLMKDKLSYEPEYHLKKVAELRADSGFWKGFRLFIVSPEANISILRYSKPEHNQQQACDKPNVPPLESTENRIIGR